VRHGNSYLPIAVKTFTGPDALRRRIEELEDRLAEYSALDNGADEAENLLRDAIEAMSEGFALFDARDRLVLCNSRYRDDIWRGLDDILTPGAPIETILRESIVRGLWSADDETPEALLRIALERHRDTPSAWDIRLSDGRWIEVGKNPLRGGGVVAVYTDISRVRSRERSLTESEERHRRLLQTLPDAVIIHSGGKIAYVNPAAIGLFGARSHTQLVGRDSRDLVHPDSLAVETERTREVLAERHTMPPIEQKRLRLDGSEVNVETRSTFIEWNGKPALLEVERDLTDRRRTEAALRESERRFSTIADNVPGAVYQGVLHPDGHLSFPYVSHGILDIHGMTAEEVMERPEWFLDRVHPEDRETLLRGFYDSARNLTPLDIHMRIVRPDGEEVWVRNIARVHGGENGLHVWEGLFVDVTDRKRAEDDLQRSEERYRRLVELSPDAIHVQAAGEIVFVNSAAVRLYGAEREADIIGMRTLDLVHPDQRDMVARCQRETLSGTATPLMEQHRVRLDGGDYWAAVTAIPMTWKGKPAGLVVIRDITDERFAQEQLQEAKDAAEFANRTKSEFLANMSHELRTPLNAVIGFSEIMSKQILGPIGNDNYRGYVNDIHESGTHLLRVINDILDLSKVESGKLMPDLAEADAREAIEASIRVVRGRAESQGIDIDRRVPEDIPPVRADERMLKQILMNLLSNAVKFTAEGGRVRIAARATSEGDVEISVTDNGIGISARDLAKVMEPFGQVESALSRKFEGTGLGLPLSRSLVELQGGEMILRSKPGLGTRVAIRLPAA